MNLGNTSRPSLKNLKPVRTTDEARAMQAKGQEKIRARKALAQEAGQRLVDLTTPIPSRITADAWDAMYTRRAFPAAWQPFYKQTLRQLLRQYAPQGATDVTQYKLLCYRAASLATTLALQEASQTDTDLILRGDAQLRSYLQALQKYTEAEKREIEISNTVLVATISKVIAIAEATVSDPEQRLAFMRALESGVASAEEKESSVPVLLLGRG